MTDILSIIASIIGTVGGWELIRYLLQRRSNQRKAAAEADGVEFAVLKETVEFLQQQLKEKEERFAEQTALLRQKQTEVLELTKEKGQVELDLQRFRCVVKKCEKREPQNGY